jgi:hypothetical protein
MMEDEFERLLKREKKVSAWTTGVLLFVGVSMFFWGWVVEFNQADWRRGYVLLILAAYCFIGYYRLRQSRVNLEFARTIRDIRERLDKGVDKSDD